jgi:hypothetical protein
VNRRPKPRFPELLSPAGAGIILICFFLPWLKVSCGSKDIIVSGWSIGGILWLIFACAFAMLAGYVILRNLVKVFLLKGILIFCTALSFAVIFYKYVTAVNDPDIPFYVPSSMINFKFRPGAFGMAFGLLMSAAGAFLIGRSPAKGKTQSPATGTETVTR